MSQPIIHIKLKSNQEIVATCNKIDSSALSGEKIYKLDTIRYLNYTQRDGEMSVVLIPFSPMSTNGEFSIHGEVVMAIATDDQVSSELIALYKQQTSSLDLTGSTLGGISK